MKTRLIILNQLDLPFFSQWLKKFSQTQDGIEYWNSDLPADDLPHVKIRKSPRYNRDSTFGRFVAWIKYTWVCFWRLLWYPRKTPVFLTTTPPIVVIMMWVVYKIKKHPYVILEWDIYPQIAHVMGMFSSRNPIYKIWYWLHGVALRNAHQVIAISDGMADVLHEMAKRDIPLVVITNWADTDHFHPMERANSPFAQAQGITDQLVVSYSGNMGETHAIETLVELIKPLTHRDDILFLFNGKGSKRHIIEEAVASAAYPNLRLLDWIAYDEYPQFMACVDISLITLASGYEKLSLPNRTYSSLASGSALLTISDEPSDLAVMVKKHGCGENFSADNITGMVNWITALADNRAKLGALRDASRHAAVTEYSEAVCTAKLNEVLLGLLNKL